MGIERLSSIWPEWRAVEKIGEGSFGKVYKAVREDEMTSYAAIKVVTIPQNEGEIISLRSEGMDEEGTRTYFSGLVKDYVNEIKVMESLKGVTNIVSVEDYRVVEHEQGIGWDIFIRMELLVPFNDFLNANTMTEADVIKLGIDICTALELCEQKNIIHRDIKPENIFLSTFGDFKVGDFGVAKELEKTSGSLSSKGTYNYMAPEVAKGQSYNSTVDIYSLGIVLYKLLNNNRLPLVDPYAEQLSYQERKSAADRRLAGEALPPPCNASKDLANMILFACAYDPSKRFKSAKAFKNALMSVAASAGDPSIVVDYDSTVGVRSVPIDPSGASVPPVEVTEPKKKKKIVPIIIASLVAVAVLVGGVFFLVKLKEKKDQEKAEAAVQEKIENSSEAVITALEKGDFTEALNARRDVEKNAEDALTDKLNERLDALYDEYKNGELTYDRAVNELDTVEKMKLGGTADKVTETREKVDALNASIIAYTTAENFYASGDYKNAMKQYILVIEEDPGYTDAQSKYDDSVLKFRSGALDQAEEYADEDKYDEAVETLTDALEVLVNDAQLTPKLTEYKSKYEDYALDEANKLVEAKKFDDAIELLDTALEIIGESDDIADMLEDVASARESDYISQIDALIKSKDFDGAEELLTEAMRYLPDSEALKEKKTELANKREADYLAQADALITAKKFDDAEALLNGALEVLPNNAAINAKLEEVAESKPKLLNDIDPINGGGWSWNAGTPIDPFGVTYTGLSNFVCFPLHGDYKTYSYYAEYRLYGEYSTLSFDLVPYKDIPENATMSVKVYCDDTLEYTGTVGRKTDKFNVSVDISGADYVKIVVAENSYDVNSWNEYTSLIMSDAKVYK